MVQAGHLRHFLTALIALTVAATAMPCALRADTPTMVADVPTGTRSANVPLIEVASIDAARGRVALRFTLPRAGMVRITLTGLDGKEVGTLASGLSNAGENRLEIDVRAIPSGEYHCILHTRDGNASAPLVITR